MGDAYRCRDCGGEWPWREIHDYKKIGRVGGFYTNVPLCPKCGDREQRTHPNPPGSSSSSIAAIPAMVEYKHWVRQPCPICGTGFIMTEGHP